jgi:hypothetical protein
MGHSPAVRIVISLLMLLGACAAPSPPPPETGPASSLARAALVEWEAWGRITVEGWPAERPTDTAATPERFERLLGYWRSVPGGEGIARRLVAQRMALVALLAEMVPDGEQGTPGGDVPRPLPVGTQAWSEDIGLYAYPAWSAAFISALARRAGLPESDLPSTYRHARYIDHALARAGEDPAGARFLPHAPEDFAPRSGDLLCADRAWAPLTHWSQRLAETGRPRPMHCDVVIRAGPGRIEAIGGNVQDLVVLRRFPADGRGRVLPAPPGRPPFVLILEWRDPGESDPPPAVPAPPPDETLAEPQRPPGELTASARRRAGERPPRPGA